MNQPRKNHSEQEQPRTSRRSNRLLHLCAVLVPVLVIFGVTLVFIPKLDGVASAEPADAGSVARDAAEKLIAQAETEDTLDKKSSEKAAEEEEPAKDKKEKEKAEEKAAAEKQAAETPPPPSDPTMSLTVPRLDLYGDIVRNSAKPGDLHRGAIKVPITGFPWQGGANTYIAGHRVGFAGTESYYQFYYLPAMQKDDAVYLTDANGTTYEYRVTEIFAVSPSENWVTAPIPGRDVVTLQTCTESLADWWTLGPNLFNSTPSSGRLVVRADKVAVDYPGEG